ncbi:MAG TPA: diacylglycerol kinase [Rhodanobacteraceae bacterium]|nr:diacylglycerol kinase [Rhodanobacteraceae bacterium]
MPSTIRRGPRQVWQALIWSLKGLRAGWRVEASFRLEVCLTVVLFPLGIWLGNGPVEKVLLCGSLLLVLAIELLNSALEAVVDHVCPDTHPFAERAKDMGSAAVFIAMLCVLLTWILILGSRLV